MPDAVARHRDAAVCPALIVFQADAPLGRIGPASAVVDDEATNANAEDATSAASFLLSCFHGFLRRWPALLLIATASDNSILLKVNCSGVIDRVVVTDH